MGFVTDLVLKYTGESDWFTLDRPLIFAYRAGIGDVNIIVPEGFRTDLASIPPAVTPILPVNDTHMKAAVLHDFMYRDQMVTRSLADRIFLAAMRELKIPGWKAWAMYAAVRLFGGRAWEKNAAKA